MILEFVGKSKRDGFESDKKVDLFSFCRKQVSSKKKPYQDD